MAAPNIFLRQFQTATISDWVPGKLVETYTQLEALAFGICEKDRSEWRVHFHFEDGACEGKALPFLWDRGAYFGDACLKAGKLHVFAHFEEQRGIAEDRRRTVGPAVAIESSNRQYIASSPLPVVDEADSPVSEHVRPMGQTSRATTRKARKRPRSVDLSSNSDESDLDEATNLRRSGNEVDRRSYKDSGEDAPPPRDETCQTDGLGRQGRTNISNKRRRRSSHAEGFSPESLQNGDVEAAIANILNPEMALDSLDCPIPGCAYNTPKKRGRLVHHISTHHPEFVTKEVGNAQTRQDNQEKFDRCMKQQHPPCLFPDCTGKKASGFASALGLIYHIHTLHPEHGYLTNKYTTKGNLRDEQLPAQNTPGSRVVEAPNDLSSLKTEFDRCMKMARPPCPIPNCTGRSANGHARPDCLVAHVRNLHPEYVHLLIEHDEPTECLDRPTPMSVVGRSNVGSTRSHPTRISQGSHWTCPAPGCRTKIANDFDREGDIARHMRSCHPDWRPTETSDSTPLQAVAETSNGRREYRCPVIGCDLTRSFTPFGNLKNHAKIKHPGVVVVDQDGTKSSQLVSLVTNKHVCPVSSCDRKGSFSTRHNWNQHMRCKHPNYKVHPNGTCTEINSSNAPESTEENSYRPIRALSEDAQGTFACPVEGCATVKTRYDNFNRHMQQQQHPAFLRAIYESEPLSFSPPPSTAEYWADYLTFTITNAAPGEFGHRPQRSWNSMSGKSCKRIAMSRLINGRYGVLAPEPCRRCKDQGLVCLVLHPGLQEEDGPGSLSCGECTHSSVSCTNAPGLLLRKLLSQGSPLPSSDNGPMLVDNEADGGDDSEKASEHDLNVEERSMNKTNAQARVRTEEEEIAYSEDDRPGNGSNGNEDDNDDIIPDSQVIDLGSSASIGGSTISNLEERDVFMSAPESPNAFDQPIFDNDEIDDEEPQDQRNPPQKDPSVPPEILPRKYPLHSRSESIPESSIAASQTSLLRRTPLMNERRSRTPSESIIRIRSSTSWQRATPNYPPPSDIRPSPLRERSIIRELLERTPRPGGTPLRNYSTISQERVAGSDMSVRGSRAGTASYERWWRGGSNATPTPYVVDFTKTRAGARDSPRSSLAGGQVDQEYESMPQDAMLQNEIMQQHQSERTGTMEDELYD